MKLKAIGLFIAVLGTASLIVGGLFLAGQAVVRYSHDLYTPDWQDFGVVTKVGYAFTDSGGVNQNYTVKTDSHGIISLNPSRGDLTGPGPIGGCTGLLGQTFHLNDTLAITKWHLCGYTVTDLTQLR